MVGADIGALTAFNTFILIDYRFAAGFLKGNRSLGTYLHTGMGHAALAAVGNKHLFFRAAVAGEFDNID